MAPRLEQKISTNQLSVIFSFTYAISILSHSCFTMVFTDGAQVSQLQTCSVWEFSGVARSWLQHPVTFMLHCGDHRWHTGNRVSNFNLLFVGLTVYTLLCGVHGWLIENVPVQNLLCIGWIVSCAFQLCTSCKTSMPYHCPGEQYICNYFLLRLQPSLDSGYTVQCLCTIAARVYF